MTYQEENDKLLNSFLGRTFFKTWRSQEEGLENFRTLELFLNTKCNLKCSYCYLANFGNELYPLGLQDDKRVLANLRVLLDWLLDRRLAPKLELFSGDPFSLQALNMILDKFESAESKPKSIVIPTNYTFILDENLTRKIESIIERSRKLGMPISLSASIDGKYCEANRPFRSGKNDPRDDGYYDRVFAFNKKWGFSFHPMIYSGHIDSWQNNFLWFQEMLKKHDIPWSNIYLLEVRNKEWSRDSILGFEEFIKFLIRWTFFAPCHGQSQEFVRFLFKRGFNILQSPLTTIGRGIGCSIQSTIHVRLGDLAIVPCHRTSYEPFITGHFIVDGGRITGIRADNPELFIGIISLQSRNQPMCELCLIKHLCSGGCLGSQFETTGDLFSPIPSVCQLEHAKIRAMITAYKELRVFDLICDRVNLEKRYALNILEEMLNGTRRPEKVPGNS
ncbi:hypothetical protein ES705_07110 [subsurface metagenome]